MFHKLLAKYGILFLFSFLGSFFVLVTYISGNPVSRIPGDIVIPSASLYLPFGSSIAIAAGIVIVFEIYSHFKR